LRISSSSSRSDAARLLRGAVACLVALLCAPAHAGAEWHITPTLGLTFGGSTTLVDLDVGTAEVHPVIGVSGSWLSTGFFGAEGIASIAPGYFQTGEGRIIESSRLTVLMGNVVFAAPRKHTEYFLRPFVSGGFGLIRAAERDAPLSGIIDIKANLAGFNIGGGAVGFLTKSVGVRFDLRYYSTLHATERPPGQAVGDARLRYMTAAVGLVFRR
jgi:hypothetical protein